MSLRLDTAIGGLSLPPTPIKGLTKGPKVKTNPASPKPAGGIPKPKPKPNPLGK